MNSDIRFKFSEFFGTICYVGHIPFAPGTFGSLVALIAWYYLKPFLSDPLFLLITGAIFFFGIVVTDISNQALQVASDLGASETINVADNVEELNKFSNSKGFFDIMFECSGSEQALLGAINSIKPRGLIVQLGMSGDMRVPMQFITTKEITLKGSFRFHEEFELGVSLMLNGNIDVLPLLSHSLPFQDAVQAFNLANDRTKSMKVQLVF